MCISHIIFPTFFSNNKIQSIDPTAFASPTANIKVLDLSHNLLSSFNPSFFTNLSMLGQLDLSYNQITDMTSAASTSSITILNLSHNRLSTFMISFLQTMPV